LTGFNVRVFPIHARSSFSAKFQTDITLPLQVTSGKIILRKFREQKNNAGLPGESILLAKQIQTFIKNSQVFDAVSTEQFHAYIEHYLKTEADMDDLGMDMLFIKHIDVDDLGNGSDEDPFCMFITSKRLLSTLHEQAQQGALLFYLDATHKLVKLGYNVSGS
jgi:hypothetical protein